MATPVEQFINQTRSQIPCSFSSRVESAYSNIIEWMKTEPHMHGFDERKSGSPELTDGSPYGIARQFFHLFQTHNAKAYYSLLALGESFNKGIPKK